MIRWPVLSPAHWTCVPQIHSEEIHALPDSSQVAKAGHTVSPWRNGTQAKPTFIQMFKLRIHRPRMSSQVYTQFVAFSRWTNHWTDQRNLLCIAQQVPKKLLRKSRSSPPKLDQETRTYGRRDWKRNCKHLSSKAPFPNIAQSILSPLAKRWHLGAVARF